MGWLKGAALTLLFQLGGAPLLLCWAVKGQGLDQLGACNCAAAKGAACTHRRLERVVNAGLQGRLPEVRFEKEIWGEV